VSLALVASERFAEHQTPPGHPERSERAEIMDVVAAEWRRQGGDVIAPRAAGESQLTRVHDASYVRAIASMAGSSRALDPDTYTSPESHEIAALAAGAAIDAVERVLDAKGRRAFALVRPPGHHAERDRAMGFCLYNNAAVAAAHARAAGLSRVAIVDYDVHHGNGTQHIFEADPSILYVSLHQSPFYPGTGDAIEVGSGAGEGYTVNVPLAAGAVDDDYQLVFSKVVVPVLHQFDPELLIVSAGFDAHERDPLGAMRLTTPAFEAMTRELARVADDCCAGRLVAVVEGGYDARSLTDCLRASVRALSADPSGPIEWPSAGHVTSTRGQSALKTVAAALASFWKL
jgi:acetoin utilization deacetylase AcuC-like enzyme